MYSSILVGLDGSAMSDSAAQAALELAKLTGSRLICCHVYAAEMHRRRFSEMEIGLPVRYQTEEKLEHLRGTHDDIISNGMKLISDAYLQSVMQRAAGDGVVAESVTPQGRNYVRFLEVLEERGADLTVVGATGQGTGPDTDIGSFAERVLLHTSSADVLVARKPWGLGGGPIVVGVDGSEDSYMALRRAAGIGRLFSVPIEVVAVYDPYFHSGVFSSISGVLSAEKAGRFNFAAQERLHDEIIDDGLRSVYESKLDDGIKLIQGEGVRVQKTVLTGKVFPQLAHFAEVKNSGLIVVGRYGIHREQRSIIGSVPHNLARKGRTNLLVVGRGGGSDALVATPVGRGSSESPLRAASGPTPTSQSRVADEERGGQIRGDRMDSDPVSTRRPDSVVKGTRQAEAVVLRKTKRLAPGFHEHIARSRIVGCTVEVGDRLLVYEIVRTSPEGRVIVTADTKLEFS